MKQENYSGDVIVIEGPDGAGTTTMSRRLAEDLNADWTCEPTDKKTGVKVDEMISEEGYSPESVALAFASDRILHIEEDVMPMLKDGRTVVSDRYVYSSLIYQPEMGADQEWVREINTAAVEPELTIILDVTAELGMERVGDRGSEKSIFEELDFQSRVASRYRQMEEREEVVIVDATRSEDEVYREIRETVRTRMGL